MKKSFVLIFLALTSFLFSQNNQVIDSLIRSLETIKDDTIKIRTLDYIFWEYAANDFDKALEYADKQLALSQKIKYKRGEAAALINIGSIYENKGEPAEALKYYIQNLKLNEEGGFKQNIPNAYLNMANIYIDLQDYDKVLENNLRALKLIRELPDTNEINMRLSMAAIYSSVGSSYFYLNNYPRSLEYYFAGLDLFTKLDDKKSIPGCYNNIGVAYQNLKEFDKALEAYQKCLKLSEEINSLQDIADAYVNVGKLFIDKGEAKMAISYFEKALLNPHLNENNIVRLSIYDAMIEAYGKLEDFKNKSIYFAKYVGLKDSIFNKEKSEQIASMRAKFDTDEKEKENTILTSQNKIQALELSRKNYFIVGFVLLFLFAGVIVWLLFRQNKFRSEQKAMQLEQKLLRSQMNPHFMFNALQAIESFITDEKAEKYLSNFASLTRSVLESSRLEAIPLKKEITLLKNYLDLQKLLHGEQFNYSINIAPDIDSESILIPPMISQPFIENSIEHGFRELESGGFIEISFSTDTKKLFLEIKDNGIGLKEGIQKHQSLATTITQERIALINKKKNKATFTISEAYPGAARCGVKVSFTLPLLYD